VGVAYKQTLLPQRLKYLYTIRLDEEAVLKTVGVDSPWGFESLRVRHRKLSYKIWICKNINAFLPVAICVFNN